MLTPCGHGRQCLLFATANLGIEILLEWQRGLWRPCAARRSHASRCSRGKRWAWRWWQWWRCSCRSASPSQPRPGARGAAFDESGRGVVGV